MAGMEKGQWRLEGWLGRHGLSLVQNAKVLVSVVGEEEEEGSVSLVRRVCRVLVASGCQVKEEEEEGRGGRKRERGVDIN